MMNPGQCKTRRLEISVELHKLAVRDCELRAQMLTVEKRGAELHQELAEITLEEHENGWAELVKNA